MKRDKMFQRQRFVGDAECQGVRSQRAKSMLCGAFGEQIDEVSALRLA